MGPILHVAEDTKSQLEGMMGMIESIGHDKNWHIPPTNCNLTIDTIHHASEPSVTFKLQIIEDMCSIKGDLHGGCAITIIDELTTAFLGSLATPGLFTTLGATRNLRATYLRPVHQGIDALVVCKLEHAGKRQAVLSAKMYNAETGELCVMAEHEKINTDLPASKA